MRAFSTILSGAVLTWALVFATPALAQTSHPANGAHATPAADHAQPRATAPEGHRDRDFDRGFAFGGFYGPYWPGFGWGPYSAWNYWAPFYGYYPYGPGYYGYYGTHYYDGGIKLKIKGPSPKDAQVFADGRYVGTVDDFNGTFQHLSLRPGPHTIEVRADGYRPLTLKVRIEPDKTVTYQGHLQPAG